MAGLVAHIYCALTLVSSGTLKIDNERAFIMGVAYPSISLINFMPAQSSYTLNPTWQDIVNAPNDFEKGIRLHALINQVRTDHLEKPLEPRLPSLPVMKQQIVAFYEDSLLYKRINRWPAILRYFDTILPEERNYDGHPDMVLHAWHTFVRTYCGQQPSAISTHVIFNEMPTVRSKVPVGLPSLASKAYVAIGFRSLNKAPITQPILRFYDDCVRLISSR